MKELSTIWRRQAEGLNPRHKFSCVIILLLFVFTAQVILTGLPVTQSAFAEEIYQKEAAAKARDLQLQGTQLQLKGDLKGAVEKYRESIGYKPNPGLEKLVGTLEGMIVKKEKAAAGAAAQTEQPGPPVGEQPPVDQGTPSAAKAAPETPAAEVMEAKPVPAEPVPAPAPERVVSSPEEELIYAFTDWFIDLFPQKTAESGFGLKTNRNYSISAESGKYRVELDEFVFFFGENETFSLSPLVLDFKPEGSAKLAVQIDIPEKTVFETAGKVDAELRIPDRSISGVWDRATLSFDSSNLKLGNAILTSVDGKTMLEVKQLLLENLYTKNASAMWTEKYLGSLKGIVFTDGSGTVSIGDMTFQYALDGTGADRYEKIKKSLINFSVNLEEGDLAGSKQFFTSLDEYLQLLDSYSGQFTATNIAIDANDGITKWDSFSLKGGAKKNGPKNTFTIQSNGLAKGFAFKGKTTPENTQPMSFTLDEVIYSDKTDIAVPQPTLFADLFATLERAEKAEGESAGQELAGAGLGFTKTFLGLFKTYSMELGVKAVAVDKGTGEGKVQLDSAKIGGGFDVASGQGGKIHGLLSFSGFDPGAPDNTTVPQAATINFTLDKIPSILNLISDPAAIAQGNLEQAKGEIMLNAMNTFMMSAMLFSVNDSFISFPNSRFNLDLALNLDNTAKYFSTGTLKMVMENPDDLMKIAQSLGADQDMQQMLTTITALSNRTTEQGKVVDRIEAKVDKEGKVFVNTKDVTLLLMPEKKESAESSSPQPDSAGATVMQDGITIKGFNINMPFEEACNNISAVAGIPREQVVDGMEVLMTPSCSDILPLDPSVSLLVMADENKIIQKIVIGGQGKYFKATDMDFASFVQTFIEAYGLEPWEEGRDKDGSYVEYREDGLSVTISENKDVVISRTPRGAERSFN